MISYILNNLVDLAIYAMVFITSASFIYIANKESYFKLRKNILTAIGLSIPILFAGIRYGVGVDYYAYASMVNNLMAGEKMYYRDIEPLSTSIANLSSALGGPHIMFTVFAAITILFAYYTIKKLAPEKPSYISLSYLAYLFIIFPTTLNGVRSGAAVSLVLFGFSLLTSQRTKYTPIWITIWFITASMIHMSAIIFLPIALAIYFYTSSSKNRGRLELLFLTLSLLVAIFFPILIQIIATIPLELINNYSRFLPEIGNQFNIPLYTLVILFILSFLLITSQSNYTSSQRFNIIKKISIYYIPMAILVGWVSSSPGLSRLSFYLDPVVILLYAHVINDQRERLSQKSTTKSILLLVAISATCVLFARNLLWAQALPYNTIFSSEARED